MPADITSNLELHLTLDDQSGTDSSGNGRTATFHAASGYTWPKIYNAGQVGSAISFRALSNQYLTIPSLTGVLGDNASLCIWVKRTQATPVGDVDSGFLNLGSNATGFGSGTNIPFSDGNAYFGIFRGVSNSTSSSVGPVTLPVGVDRTHWFHVAITTTPGANGWKLYINGSVVTTATGITGVYYDDDQWTIGYQRDYGSNYYFDGALDDGRIYSRTLSQADILAVMDAADTPRNTPFASVVAPSCHFGLMTFIPLSENSNEVGGGTENINRFNPPPAFTWDSWLDSAVRLGSKAVFMTTKHCDGLTLWQSVTSGAMSHSIQNTTWVGNSRDLVNEFCVGARARGMDVGFYFAVGDGFLKAQNSNGFGGTYTTKILGQLTELLTNYGAIKFVVLDAWGNWWTSNNSGFPGFSDIAINTIYDAIKAIQPTCQVGINNHEDLSGDMRVFEETVEGEPAAGYTQPTMCWRVLPRVDPAVAQRWFTHSDTLTEPLQPGLQQAKDVEARMKARGYIMAHNYSIGPNGLLTSDLANVVNGIGAAPPEQQVDTGIGVFI